MRVTDMFPGVIYLQVCCGSQISILRSGEHLFDRDLARLVGKGSLDEASDRSRSFCWEVFIMGGLEGRQKVKCFLLAS